MAIFDRVHFSDVLKETAYHDAIITIGRLINEEETAQELLHQVLFFTLLYESICTDPQTIIPTEFGSSTGSYQAYQPPV